MCWVGPIVIFSHNCNWNSTDRDWHNFSLTCSRSFYNPPSSSFHYICCQLYSANCISARRGEELHFVSATNGDIGHWKISEKQLAVHRLAKVQQAARMLGIKTTVLDNHDGELEPTLDNRKTLTRLIREWNVDIVIIIVIGHLPNDYHPDHRYENQAMVSTLSSFQKRLRCTRLNSFSLCKSLLSNCDELSAFLAVQLNYFQVGKMGLSEAATHRFVWLRSHDRMGLSAPSYHLPTPVVCFDRCIYEHYFLL